MPNPLDWTLRATVVLIIGLVLANHAGYFDREAKVPTTSVQHLSGREYFIADVLGYFPGAGVADLIYSADGNSNDRPLSFRLALLENGQRLRPPDCVHQDIVDQGNGRFCHWSNALLFSSSDNSDPRTNGRIYSIVQRAETARLIAVPVLAVLALLAWRQRRLSFETLPEFRFAAAAMRSAPLWYGISISLGLYIVGCYVFGAPPIPLIEPDSTAYWLGLSAVPVGYSVVLWAAYDVFGSLRGVAAVQILLFFTAVIAAQSGIARATGSAAAAGIAALLIFVFGAATSTAIWMLSESVFTSVLLLHVAAAGWAFARPTRLNLVLLALTAVIALTIRPAGYFVLGGIIFLAIFWSGRRLLVLRWAVCPLIVFALTYYGLGLVTRGHADQTNLGANLFGHVAHLYDASLPGLSPDLANTVDTPSMRRYRAERAETSDWLKLQEFEDVEFNRVLNDFYGELDKSGDNDREGVLLRLSILTIKNHPIGYLETVLQNLYAWFYKLILFTLPDVGARLAGEYQRFWPNIEEFRPFFGQANENITLEDVRNGFFLTSATVKIPLFQMPPTAAIIIKIAFAVGGAAASIGFLFGYARAGTQFLAYVFVLTLGGALLVALSTVFIPRYAIPLDPLVIITATVGAWHGLIIAAAGARRAARARRHGLRGQVLEHLTPSGRLPHAVD